MRRGTDVKMLAYAREKWAELVSVDLCDRLAVAGTVVRVHLAQCLVSYSRGVSKDLRIVRWLTLGKGVLQEVCSISQWIKGCGL